MWVQKHRPEKLEEIAGNPKLVQDLKRYHWKKPLLIYGPTGVGKTSLINSLACELGFEIVEVTNENLDSAKATAQTASIFGGKRLLLIDNVDQIKDIKKVADLLKESRNPITLLTSDFGSKRLATIKKMAEKLQMRRPTAKTLERILQQICNKEDVIAEAGVLEKISENSAGDIRSAINDLETAAKGRKKISMEDLEVLEKRDKTSDVYKALSLILTKKDFKEAVTSLYDLDEQPKDVLLWIDENMPYIYTDKEDIWRAYEYIAKADIFLGRITNRQYWGFLRYVNTLMSGGVNISKKKQIRYSMYRFPSYLIKMSQTKKERNIRKTIGEKLSPILHASCRVIDKEYIPLFKTLLKNERINGEELMEKYRLGEEEVEYLNG
ncbi:MAG: AAA family ATPase [Candidatus Altiarchaeota archaeon]|nr:AAA family ATPase [Candidatus Altiarchaeota archaeon]